MTKYLNSKSLCIFLAVLIFLLHYYIREYNYNHWTNILGWDVLSYYLYLPFTFIYHDPGLVNQSVVDHIFEQYRPSGTFYQAFHLPNGNWVSTYTCGLAILYLPFFFIAHLWASLSHSYPADGFSFPYQFCIANGVMLYIVAGIFVIRKVLLSFFNDRITSIVIALLLIGTNYLHETLAEECMPHAILFTAYALILLLTIQWHRQPNIKIAAWLGFIMGFAILIRGSEIVLIVIPLLWNIYDKDSFKNKWTLIRKNSFHILVAVLCFLVIPFLQMLFWKKITGSFIFQSYQNTEGFDWGGDYIMKVLFAYKKSWFLYTPMIILPIIGIYFMKKMYRPAFWSVFLFFILNFYLIASWAAWWQGGSFGMRYFVESYAVMAIPFGFFLKKMGEQKFLLKSLITLLAGFFLFLNIFQTWQFNNWILDGYAMTKDYYWKVFLKTRVSDEDKKLKEIDRNFTTFQEFQNQQDYVKHTLGYFDFDSINSIPVESFFLDSVHALSPPFSCRLTKEHIYSPTFRMPYNTITKREHAFIRVTLSYFPVYDLKESPASIVIHFDHKGRFTNNYRGYNLEDQTYKLNQWNRISADYLTPYPLSEDDKLVVYVYLRGEKELYIDNLHIEAFERKW
jgi:hypothetical protein